MKQNHRIQSKRKGNTKNSPKRSVTKNTIRNDLSKNDNVKSRTTSISQINGEKAYKLLALQQNISINKAKSLIDSGSVSVNGKRVLIARAIIPKNVRFEVADNSSCVIFEDEKILALDKSAGIDSLRLLELYPNYKLINRLDKDTSGVILLSKVPQMQSEAKIAFRQKQVEKIYFGLVEGKLYEEITIEKKISTKKGYKAVSRIDKNGLSAISKVTPLEIFHQTTLVSVEILTGRTHQIRIHLASINHPIVGDIIYNKHSHIKSKRLMLHCHKTALLGYTFQSKRDVHELFEVN